MESTYLIFSLFIDNGCLLYILIDVIFYYLAIYFILKLYKYIFSAEQRIGGPLEGASPIRSDYGANLMGTSSEVLIYLCIANPGFDLKTFCLQYTTIIITHHIYLFKKLLNSWDYSLKIELLKFYLFLNTQITI